MKKIFLTLLLLGTLGLGCRKTESDKICWYCTLTTHTKTAIVNTEEKVCDMNRVDIEAYKLAHTDTVITRTDTTITGCNCNQQVPWY